MALSAETLAAMQDALVVHGKKVAGFQVKRHLKLWPFQNLREQAVCPVESRHDVGGQVEWRGRPVVVAHGFEAAGGIQLDERRAGLQARFRRNQKRGLCSLRDELDVRRVPASRELQVPLSPVPTLRFLSW